MAYIQTVSEEEASGATAELYAAERAARGYVPNFAGAFGQRPELYRAWRGLVSTVMEGMDPRRFELATLAAARRLRSSYCALAHGAILADRFLDAQAVCQLARGEVPRDLDEVEVAVMDLAGKAAADATSVTAADIQHLRDLGLDDGEIVDVVAAAAVRCFFSTMLDALGAEPDGRYRELPDDLREALAVGRPFDDARTG
jgi:uncharacterized peroxidase-related enzyme